MPTLPKMVRSLRAIPEKNTWVGGRGQVIYFSMGGWCAKFSNYMGHWCSTKSNYMGGWYSLRGSGRKDIICQNKREVLTNLAQKRVEHSKLQLKRPFLFMPNRQNSDVSVEYW